MKKYLCLFLFLGLLFLGCSDDHEEKRQPTGDLIKLSIIPTISTNYEAGIQYLGVITDLPWRASSSADWLSVSSASGTGSSKVGVSWKENKTLEDRQAKVVFSVNGMETTLTVTQGHKVEASHIVSFRPILGNQARNEVDSVEVIFNKPTKVIGHTPPGGNGRMFDEGLRWQLPIGKWGLGDDVEVRMSFKPLNDSIVSRDTITVPFYEKKFLLTEPDDAIRNSALSLDKKSIWVAVTNKLADKNKVMQISLDDMTVIKSVKMPFDPQFLCVNPYNGLLYVLPYNGNFSTSAKDNFSGLGYLDYSNTGHSHYFCVVDPEQGKILKTIDIEPSLTAHPQYPEIYPDEIAFTKDGFGILRLVSVSATGLEWRYIDSADGDKITLSGYDWSEHEFERLYPNYDYSRIYANPYPRQSTSLEWVNRQHPVPTVITLHNKFNSDEYYAGGYLAYLSMSPFANKAFICTNPACQVVVGLDGAVTYSKVIIEETRGSMNVWDELVQDKDYVYKIHNMGAFLELLDMTKSEVVFASSHHIGDWNQLMNCHFLPTTDQLVLTEVQGIWIYNAAAIKNEVKR